MRKVYVACSSADLPRARQAMETIRNLGGEVTHDWTDDIMVHGSDGRDLDIAAASQCVAADIDGIQRADVVLLLDGGFSYGRTVEIGAALMAQKPIVAAGRATGRLWEAGEWARFSTDLLAIRYVMGFDMEVPL